MTFCLSCNDDRIKLQELHKKFVALLTDWLSLMAFEYFRTENRIMLCKWFVSFDMEIRLTVSGYAVKGYRFFNNGNQCMTDTSQHAVIRPYRKIIFTAFFQFFCIVKKVPLSIILIDLQTITKGRIEFPNTFKNIFFRYVCKRRWMFSFIINDINGVKNLHGLMSVHGWTDLCNHFKIPVNEFTQPAVIVNRPCARTSADIEFKPGYTERVLYIYGN